MLLQQRPTTRLPRAFHSPSTLEEAAALVAEHRGAARLAAGSTYLMLMAAHGEVLSEHLVSLHRVGGLDRVAEGEVGALATLRRLERGLATGPQRALTMAASVTAGPSVRTLGTLGGNLGFADGDLVPALLALGAQVHLHGAAPVSVADYVERRPTDAIITGVTHTLRADGGWSGAAVKLAHRGMDWPIVCAAAVLRTAGEEIVDARVAAGALAPLPVLLPAVGAVLVGSRGEPEALDYAAEITPERLDLRADAEASAAYRRRVAGAVVRRAIALALELGPAGTPAPGAARYTRRAPPGASGQASGQSPVADQP